MNKIKQIMIGVGMVALSGNAAAYPMLDNPEMGYDDVKSLIPLIMETTYDSEVAQRFQFKIMKKDGKLTKKALKLEEGRGNEKKLTRKTDKLGIKIANFVGRLPAGSVSNIETLLDEGGGNESVPEPSTIALLGLGLIGIGAARRLRKKAR